MYIRCWHITYINMYNYNTSMDGNENKKTLKLRGMRQPVQLLGSRVRTNHLAFYRGCNMSSLQTRHPLLSTSCVPYNSLTTLTERTPTNIIRRDALGCSVCWALVPSSVSKLYCGVICRNVDRGHLDINVYYS